MPKFNFNQPEFLFCEIAIKNGSPNDNRIWIYHRLSLSLIEFVNVDDFKDFQFKGIQQLFQYETLEDIENWVGVFVQNNCDATDNVPTQVLQSAWNYLKDYFIWEDNNIKEAGS